MNQLLQKFNDYKSIVNYKIRYEFEDGNKKYLESFFYEPSDRYLNNQKRIKIKNIKIYDNKDNIFLQDTLF